MGCYTIKSGGYQFKQYGGVCSFNIVCRNFLCLSLVSQYINVMEWEMIMENCSAMDTGERNIVQSSRSGYKFVKLNHGE